MSNTSDTAGKDLLKNLIIISLGAFVTNRF